MDEFIRSLKSFGNKEVILITGDTGFKGNWLCSVLLKYGIRVVGFSDENKLL